MVFCNESQPYSSMVILCHNPYFNRWFSAICLPSNKRSFNWSHNPYFNRWFSAITNTIDFKLLNSLVTILILIDGFLQLGTINLENSSTMSHNPYFNRWFSAIYLDEEIQDCEYGSQSLF